MRVDGAGFIAKIFCSFVGRSSGAFPSFKKFSNFSNSLGAASTLNRFASGKSSSIPVRSYLVSSQDR
jgi:hypothetical protein